MNPLLVGPRLIVRALDDLHALARSATAAVSLGQQIDRRGEQLVALGEQIVALAEQLDRRGEQIVAAGDRIDRRGDELLRLADTFETLGNGMVAEARATQEAAHGVVAAAGEVVSALPLLERALALGEPLEGTLERVGRIVDRLPGGRRGERP